MRGATTSLLPRISIRGWISVSVTESHGMSIARTLPQKVSLKGAYPDTILGATIGVGASNKDDVRICTVEIPVKHIEVSGEVKIDELGVHKSVVVGCGDFTDILIALFEECFLELRLSIDGPDIETSNVQGAVVLHAYRLPDL